PGRRGVEVLEFVEDLTATDLRATHLANVSRHLPAGRVEQNGRAGALCERGKSFPNRDEARPGPLIVCSGEPLSHKPRCGTACERAEVAVPVPASRAISKHCGHPRRGDCGVFCGG